MTTGGKAPLETLLATFGLSLILEGIFRDQYGVSGQSYSVPDALSGATNLGFMVLPNYRAWVVVACLSICIGTWFLIEKTSLGATLRASTENPALVQAFLDGLAGTPGRQKNARTALKAVEKFALVRDLQFEPGQIHGGEIGRAHV